MVTLSFLALAASSLFALATAAPTVETRQAPVWTPGTQNNTQEFYIKLHVTHGPNTYEGYYLQAYHTGAGSADPVFFPDTSSATRAFLNQTQLQFDDSAYPAAATGFPGDTNYARWEPITINAGYGGTGWEHKEGKGLVIVNEEFDGFIICEWVHAYNLPQLFVLVEGFDGGATEVTNLPSSCSNVKLVAEYF